MLEVAKNETVPSIEEESLDRILARQCADGHFGLTDELAGVINAHFY